MIGWVGSYVLFKVGVLGIITIGILTTNGALTFDYFFTVVTEVVSSGVVYELCGSGTTTTGGFTTLF